MFDSQTLSRDEQIKVLSRLAHELTIIARDTYEFGTDGVLQPHVLRAYNESLHRVTAAVVEHQAGKDSFSIKSIVEMLNSFGERFHRASEINFVLSCAFRRDVGR